MLCVGAGQFQQDGIHQEDAGEHAARRCGMDLVDRWADAIQYGRLFPGLFSFPNVDVCPTYCTYADTLVAEITDASSGDPSRR